MIKTEQGPKTITTKLIAHGGYSSAYPENTQTSYLEAQKYKPYAIEMDVVPHPTTGELICFHPHGISSTLGTFDTETIQQQLDNGMHYPTFTQMLSVLDHSQLVLVDLKNPSYDGYKRILKTTKANPSQIIVGTRNLAFVKTINPQIKTLALFANPDDFESYQQNSGIFFRLWEKDLTLERIQQIHDLGLEVWVTPGHKATATQHRTAGEISDEKLEELIGTVDAILVNDIKHTTEYMTNI